MTVLQPQTKGGRKTRIDHPTSMLGPFWSLLPDPSVGSKKYNPQFQTLGRFHLGYCRGFDHSQHHFEVWLRYLIQYYSYARAMGAQDWQLLVWPLQWVFELAQRRLPYNDAYRPHRSHYHKLDSKTRPHVIGWATERSFSEPL